MTIPEYIQSLKPTINRPYSVPTDAKKGAVIVETREIKDFGLIVKNHLHFLPKDYGLTVCHSYDNEKFVEEELKDIIGVNWLVIGSMEMNNANYNKLLTSSYFWNLIPYEKCLIFQADSLLLRKGIERFETFDYVGAPWLNNAMPKLGGNGGLSLRSKSKTLETINKFHFNQGAHGNEDVYYSMNLKGNKADKNIGMQFSVETIYFPKPIGLHAADKYLKPEQISEILTKSLEEL